MGVKEDTGSNTLAIGVLTPVQVPQNQERGSITGIVIDPTGAAVAGARVALIRDDHSADQQAVLGQTATGEDGHFVLSSSMPGPFQLSITASGFAPQTLSGVLPPGGVVSVPQITLEIATVNTEVQVGLSRTEIAQEQIQVQEKQRVLGVFPNYYVTYVPNAEPLVAKQKFELTWKFVLDPVSFGLNGVIAGIQQATNEFPGYGQGAEGYAKRFGAAYATFFTSTVISNAILMAGKLLQHPGESGRRRHLQSLLSSGRSKWSWIDIRECRHRHRRNRRRQHLRGVSPPQVDAARRKRTRQALSAHPSVFSSRAPARFC
ncbi:MAG: carboxypeptidase-like regulatory domain-containing protein [Terriglobales bacterium]